MMETGFTASGAITAALGVFTSAFDVITSNPVLLIFVGAALIPVGFKIFRSAKRAAK